MPLRDLILDDSDRQAESERKVICLISAVQKIGSLREYEVIEHFDALEIARDRLSEIMDKAEGK
jgi:hypothetical protein